MSYIRDISLKIKKQSAKDTNKIWLNDIHQ